MVDASTGPRGHSLVDAVHLDRARALFDDYAALAGPTGLLSEEHDPVAGLMLDNFPQAYSHLGLIENACNLAARGER